MIKDSEIDLTEYRDFGARHNFITIHRNGETFSNIGEVINESLKKQVYGNVPWNVSPIFISYKYDGLVAIGNKQQRAEALLYAYWGTINNQTCDCCGRKYNKIPWKKDWGICKVCEEQHKQIRVIPWEV